jgi:hypothetical protein
MTRANGLCLTIAISVMAMGLLFLQPRLACAREGSSPAQVDVSPIVESVADTVAFISWTTHNPGAPSCTTPSCTTAKISITLT